MLRHLSRSTGRRIVELPDSDGYATRAESVDRRAATLRWRAGVSVATLCVAGALWLAGGWVTTASGWTIQTGPQVSGATGSNGRLADVWCSSRTSCVAVGSYTDNSGVVRTLAERWNGVRWSIEATPNPPATADASLAGVSCTSVNACVAVGSYSAGPPEGRLTLAERWNGVVWSIQPIPSPAADTEPALNAVSCVSRKLCIAVGSFIESRYTARAIVERWNGVRWSMRRVTNPPGVVSTALLGISCASSTTCIAVGNLYTHIQPVRQLTLAERWNGSRWSLEKTPSPPGQPSPSLSSVACSSRYACTAVGTAGLVERWNGARWKIQRAPGPAQRRGIGLGSVSCASAGVCVAVGSYRNDAGASTALAERWNRGVWRILRVPHPARAKTTGLSGVWCTSLSGCTTVGSFGSTPGTQLTLAQRWNGNAWTISRTPNPIFSAASSTLEGVSCTSPEACTAVGSYLNAANRRVPLAERWNGTVWRQQQAPVPAGATASELNGVSCADTTECIAVGSYTTGSGTAVALVEAWTGSTWTIQTIPSPTPAALSDVSCPSSTACVAVGGWTAMFWNGSVWTISNAVPVPPNAQPIGGLAGVSCSSAAACTAVGSNPGLTVAEAWDGTSWIIQSTPNVPPPTAAGNWLDGVSCGSPTVCAAVGGWSAYHEGGLLAEVWDGVSWALQTPGPGGAFVAGQLNRVSCPSAGACVAVGQIIGGPVAAAWGGAAWTIQYPPAPGGATGATLNDVSCTSATACTGVGSYTPGPSTTVTNQLIEHDP